MYVKDLGYDLDFVDKYSLFLRTLCLRLCWKTAV